MISYFSKVAGMVTTFLLFAGCVSVAPRIPDPNIVAEGETRGVQARSAVLLAAPLTATAAVELALLNNTRVLAAMTRLGIARSEWQEARLVQNPVLSGSRTDGGGTHKSTIGLTQSLASLLLLPSRKRFAQGEYERTQKLASVALIDLKHEVAEAWIRCIGSRQVADMRSMVADNVATASELASRYFDAGNMSELELAEQRRAAAQSGIAALTAANEASRAKFQLQELMGLSGNPEWTTAATLPAPTTMSDSVEAQIALAKSQRADLAAAVQEVALLGDALNLAKRWRWLGAVDVGVVREREQDGAHLTGPTLSLALPIFNQGQAGIERAQLQLADAHRRSTGLAVHVENQVREQYANVAALATIAMHFRSALNPSDELIVKQQQLRENFMLIGPFELLRAKQLQYDGYQGYIEAVRDYWIARNQLARVTGADSVGTVDAEAGASGDQR